MFWFIWIIRKDNGECVIIEVKSNTIEDSVLKEIELIEYFKLCVIISHVEVDNDYKNMIFKFLEQKLSKVIVLKSAEIASQPEDNCSFKGLLSTSKDKILNRLFQIIYGKL